MKKVFSSTVAVAAALSAFMLLAAVGQGRDIRTLKLEIRFAEANLLRADRVGAKECAPKLFARAESHIAMAKIQYMEGDYWEAGDHLNDAITLARDVFHLSRNCYADFDGDGIYDRNDRCPDALENYNGYKDDDGCSDTLPRRVILILEKIELLEPIVFTPDAASIDSRSFPLMEEILRVLEESPELQVRIEGHTAATGDEDENRQSSMHRAGLVMDYLVANGVEPRRLDARGIGGGDPVISNDTEAGRAINERVEFIIVQ